MTGKAKLGCGHSAHSAICTQCLVESVGEERARARGAADCPEPFCGVNCERCGGYGWVWPSDSEIQEDAEILNQILNDHWEIE